MLLSALDSFDKIIDRLQGRRTALFLDFDGTLAPIVPHPADAQLEPGLQEVLERLVKHVPVAVISGRAVQDVTKRIPVAPLQIAGDHGLVFLEPGGERMAPPVQAAHLQALEQAADKIQGLIRPFDGAWLERKRCTFAVHTRRVRAEEKHEVVAAVDEGLRESGLLEAQQGKEVVDVRPRVEWDKGSAVRQMLRRLEVSGERFVPVVIGDDATDEPAFQAVRGHGVAVLVGARTSATAAEFFLAGPREVRRMLTLLHTGTTAWQEPPEHAIDPGRGPDL